MPRYYVALISFMMLLWQPQASVRVSNFTMTATEVDLGVGLRPIESSILWKGKPFFVYGTAAGIFAVTCTTTDCFGKQTTQLIGALDNFRGGSIALSNDNEPLIMLCSTQHTYYIRCYGTNCRSFTTEAQPIASESCNIAVDPQTGRVLFLAFINPDLKSASCLKPTACSFTTLSWSDVWKHSPGLQGSGLTPHAVFTSQGNAILGIQELPSSTVAIRCQNPACTLVASFARLSSSISGYNVEVDLSPHDGLPFFVTTGRLTLNVVKCFDLACNQRTLTTYNFVKASPQPRLAFDTESKLPVIPLQFRDEGSEFGAFYCANHACTNGTYSAISSSSGSVQFVDGFRLPDGNFFFVWDYWNSNTKTLLTTTTPNACDLYPCPYGQTCRALNSSIEAPDGRTCKCGQGEEFIEEECRDFDACAINPCVNQTEVCLDAKAPDTGYACVCAEGYSGVPCKDFDACFANSCGENGICVDLQPPSSGYGCQCDEGYSGIPCTDTRGCATDPCEQNEVCKDKKAPETGHTCLCAPGYSGAPCIDTNGCASNPCGPNEMCTDNKAPATGYVCSCAPGYAGFPCAEIDGCANEPCGLHEVCKDSRPPDSDHVCECDVGYSGTPCQDTNACLSSPCNTSVSRCVDLSAPLTGHQCICKPGFAGGPSATGESCQDLDECASNPCNDAVANCEPATPPESVHRCVCKPGFLGDPYVNVSTCTNIDACDSFPCHANATCTDVIGGPINKQGRVCQCNDGFVPHPTEQCIEYNACDSPKNKDVCVFGSFCVDDPAPSMGFMCACALGYQGPNSSNGSACFDVDECASNPCPNNSVCVAAVPPASQHECKCKDGFAGEIGSTGFTCTDVDACGLYPCVDSNANCVDISAGPASKAGRVCTCRKGFVEVDDGKDDELCVVTANCNENPCGLGSTCIDFNPGHTCQCIPPFTGIDSLNGSTCERPNCDALVLESGSVTGQCDGTRGGQCEYTGCRSGFALSPTAFTKTDITRTCLKTGEWSGSPRTCVRCNGVTEYKRNNGLDACFTMRVCSPGSYVSRAGTSSSNRQCQNCEFETYTTTANQPACLNARACSAGFAESKAPTPTSDRECQECLVSDRKYQQGTNHAECQALTVCSDTEIEVVPPSSSSDRKCAIIPTTTLPIVTNSSTDGGQPASSSSSSSSSSTLVIIIPVVVVIVVVLVAVAVFIFKRRQATFRTSKISTAPSDPTIFSTRNPLYRENSVASKQTPTHPNSQQTYETALQFNPEYNPGVLSPSSTVPSPHYEYSTPTNTREWPDGKTSATTVYEVPTEGNQAVYASYEEPDQQRPVQACMPLTENHTVYAGTTNNPRYELPQQATPYQTLDSGHMTYSSTEGTYAIPTDPPSQGSMSQTPAANSIYGTPATTPAAMSSYGTPLTTPSAFRSDENDPEGYVEVDTEEKPSAPGVETEPPIFSFS
eukprot:m.215863 g.215863  ORF g.215863 m.215863 type:complete len:1439 (+) comp26216_c1_seq3:38-4354(+)